MTDSTVTKADLVEEVVRVTELPRKESEAVVETIFESIIGALQGGDRIEIRGFGSFRTRQRRGRTGRNPKTGAKVEVPPKKHSVFQAQQGTEGSRQRRRACSPGFRLRAGCAAKLKARGGARPLAARQPHTPYGLPLDALALPIHCRSQERYRLRFLQCCRRRIEDEEWLIVQRGVKNFVILNRYPYTSGHVMIVPYAHTADFSGLERETAAEMMLLAQRVQAALEDVYHPDGFNLGMNLGRSAGAGIADHLHMHLCPAGPATRIS